MNEEKNLILINFEHNADYRLNFRALKFTEYNHFVN